MPTSRGPLPKAQALRRGGRSAPVTFTAPAAPLDSEPPAHLGEIGAFVWREVAACSWAQQSDSLAVRRLAELEDERAQLVAIINAEGHLLSRPVVSPRGDVVGEDRYANPLIAEVRRIDRQLTPLRSELGLSPMTRARLGIRILEGEDRLGRLLKDRTDQLDPRLTYPRENQ